MEMPRSIAWFAVASAASTAEAFAGPCTADIARTQERLNAALVTAIAAEHGGGVQGPGHRQPTLHSLALAEETLGTMAPQKVEVLRRLIDDARAADRIGDRKECRKALAVLQSVIGP